MTDKLSPAAPPQPSGPVVERMARAIDNLPRLWLHELDDADEWHVCHWGEALEGGGRRWVVVAEACNESEARDKMHEEVRRRRARAALAVVLAEIEAERLEYASDDPDSAEMRVIDDIVRRLTGDRADD